jgi:hypothetical protein
MIIVLYKSKIFKLYVECLVNILNTKYKNIRINLWNKDYIYDKKNVYIIFYTDINNIDKCDNYCIINTEDINNDNIIKRFEIIDKLENCKFFIDYSNDNINYINENYDNKYKNKIIYVPFGYTELYENKIRVNQNVKKIYDIVFLGALNQRRKEFFKRFDKLKLKYYYPQLKRRSIKFLLQNKEYAKGKIALSIKYYDKCGNDLFRLRDLILSNIFFLCEKNLDDDVYNYLDELNLTFNSIDECIEKIKYWLNKDDKEIYEITVKVYKWFIKNFAIEKYLFENNNLVEFLKEF